MDEFKTYIAKKLASLLPKANVMESIDQQELGGDQVIEADKLIIGSHQDYIKAVLGNMQTDHPNVQQIPNWYDRKQITVFTYKQGIPIYAFSRAITQLYNNYNNYQNRPKKDWPIHIDSKFESNGEYYLYDLNHKELTKLFRNEYCSYLLLFVRNHLVFDVIVKQDKSRDVRIFQVDPSDPSKKELFSASLPHCFNKLARMRKEFPDLFAQQYGPLFDELDAARPTLNDKLRDEFAAFNNKLQQEIVEIEKREAANIASKIEKKLLAFKRRLRSIALDLISTAERS
jgi:hypothetical protein